MTSPLMRMCLRSVLLGQRSLLERKVGPSLCAGLLEQTPYGSVSQQRLEHTIRKMSNGKRRVHQIRRSASLDEDQKSDEESDSDDEESRKEFSRAESHFWRQKMRTLHSHLDVDKDGVLSYDDFMLLGKRFAKLGHLTTEQKDEFQEVLRKMWIEQWGEISPYNLVDVEKYLREMHHVLEDKSLREKVHSFLPYLFKAVDKDKSGEISVQEFKLFFKCLGLDNDHAVISFTFIDTNEDGKISLKEFVKLGRDFFLTQDHSRPSKHFWGPLVD
ncbi:PREDICTED: sarcoplasmic calcium-binding protein [Ceratosolen solmsi marchali]|uniref:Sarcoplasmic calcium-binding protein n=1 Tax=Ceratosolen solmsi marchali TaxID=326594 RepID=A0AAJ7E381_9HYME|nr:PREDICTED: sarcoplasmic calcium-binding protein [Ceratosolen solmsi marchali]